MQPLTKLIDQTADALARSTTHRQAIDEIRYILTGPVGSRVIRESVTRRPSRKAAELHRKIHDALVLLRDLERPPYPAYHVVGEKMEKLFRP